VTLSQELLQGTVQKLSSKMALSMSEEITQRTGESLDGDRRKTATTKTEHWVARNSRHVQQPWKTPGHQEWIVGWMVRRVLTYSRTWVSDERPLRWIGIVSLRGMNA